MELTTLPVRLEDQILICKPLYETKQKINKLGLC
jgi:hypothetical protein